MIGLGCLLPFALMIVGALIGAAMGGSHAGLVGLIAGFVVGILAAAGLVWGLARAEKR
jgi:hypothetical protein